MSVKMMLNIDDDLHSWLKDHKHAEGRSIEWTINQALKEYKEKNEVKMTYFPDGLIF